MVMLSSATLSSEQIAGGGGDEDKYRVGDISVEKCSRVSRL